MKVSSTPLAGHVTIETDVRSDSRGEFERLFCAEGWRAVREGLRFVQVNLSTTRHRGTVRGMHFQHSPMAEAKLIRCVKGRVFDVAVDLRPASPTFLQWHATELAEDAPMEVFIPEGFAHGFQALTDHAQLLYFHSRSWSADHEGGVRYDDPRLAIRWPLPASGVSDRDLRHPLIDSRFQGIAP